MATIIVDTAEAQKNLDSLLTEEERAQYYVLMKKQFLFSESFSKLQFESAIHKLLKSSDKLRKHTAFQNAIANKIYSPDMKSSRSSNSNKGSFEIADYTEYINPNSPLGPPSFENKSAAAELFLPDSGFIASRVAIHTWEHQMDGAHDDVSKYLVQACQMFVKNIVTAMVSRKEGYKLKDNRFQYSIGTPVPDPYLRNTHNLLDHTQEPCVELIDGEEHLRPTTRVSLENAEHQTAYALSCTKRKRSDGRLTIQLLYDTLRENPNIVAINSMHSLNLLKIGLILESKREATT